ncbi:MAG: hypothetical protein CUN56_08985 [Phototrophicales bacterium]|nr:MAG: hypothetical protein CUN56_08985 [Phototrophicales bacterium]RMG74698.1 MAG: hypothetical protein D6711_08160 [Chloroflexota bacterium]
MDKQKIVTALGLIPGGDFSIVDIQMVQWGRDLIFECTYHTASPTVAPEHPVQINIIFKDCREVKYKIYAHISIHEQGSVLPVADIVELSLGQGNHRKDAQMLTNFFSVSISYKEIHLETNEQYIQLETF